MLEAIIGEEDEKSEAIQGLINQKGMLVSNEYSIMYCEGEFGWVATKAKVVTNSVAVRENVNKKGRRKALDENLGQQVVGGCCG